MKLTLVGAGLVFIIMGNYLPKTRKNWLMGIRSPWTLSDERVWDKTHRLAGPLFMLGGAGVIADAFFVPVAERMTVLIVAVMVPAIVSYGYSYLAARKLDLV